jgi:hypothetical protein
MLAAVGVTWFEDVDAIASALPVVAGGWVVDAAIEHGISIATAPIYLTEPMIRSTEYRLVPAMQIPLAPTGDRLATFNPKRANLLPAGTLPGRPRRRTILSTTIPIKR